MEELGPVHRYAAGALFSLALNQAQIHRQGMIPDVLSAEGEDGPNFPTLSDEEGVIPWSSEQCGLLRRILKYLDIDPQAWPGIEITASVPDAKHHIGPFIRILQEEDAGGGSASSSASSSESTKNSVKPEKSVAVLAKAVDAMALSLEEFATTRPSERDQTFEETFVAHATSPESERASASNNTSARRWASMKKPLIDRQVSDSKEPSKGTDKESSENEDQKEIERQIFIKQRKVAVLYEVLTACVADTPEEKAGKSVLKAGYDARQRVALRLLALWLDIDWEKVAAIELMVAYMAIAAEKEKEAEKATHQADEEKQGWAKWKRGGIIGAAAITGGALLAVTGGLAAPAIAAGLTALAPTVIGAGGLATAMGSAAGSAAVAASFGAAGAGLAGTKMARRTGGVDEFLFLPIGDNHQQGRLAVGIMVSGIVYDAEDFKLPWEGPDWDLERYAIRWETKELMAVSTAIEDWLASSNELLPIFPGDEVPSFLQTLTKFTCCSCLTYWMIEQRSLPELRKKLEITTNKLAISCRNKFRAGAARELFKAGAMMTVLAGLVTALAWPAALLSATDFIDGKWAIAVDRSDKAGIILAKCLLQGSQGNRPVTLVGYSLGARVIFSCLEYLAKQGNSASIVERVVLLGAPITLDQQRWKTARKVVSGRFINAYSTNDWILGVIYRASFVTQGLAGLQKVQIPGIENVDVTELVSGHNMYLGKTREILQALDIDSFYPIYPSKLHPAPNSPS